MYTRTLNTPMGTEVGGAMDKVDIAGIWRWDPATKVLKISVRYGVWNNGLVPSTRRQDSYVHEFTEESYEYIVAQGIDSEQALWTRMYEKLGEERAEAQSF